MTIKTRKQAIDAMCKSCIYCDKQPGTWRMQVENCTSKRCPLYTFRPKPAQPSSNPQPQQLKAFLERKREGK